MNQDEYAELLRHVRGWVDEIGRPDLDQLAFATVEGANVPSQFCVRYLESLAGLLSLESREGAEHTLIRIGEVVQAQDGSVMDVLLDASPAETDALGFERLSLLDALPRRGAVLDALRTLLIELRQDSGDPWEQG